MLDESHRRPRGTLKPEHRGLAVEDRASCQDVALGQLWALLAPARAEAQRFDDLITVLRGPPRAL
eukprot:403245-Alexandrium_andersonii.AAC.1